MNKMRGTLLTGLASSIELLFVCPKPRPASPSIYVVVYFVFINISYKLPSDRLSLFRRSRELITCLYDVT